MHQLHERGLHASSELPIMSVSPCWHACLSVAVLRLVSASHCATFWLDFSALQICLTTIMKPALGQLWAAGKLVCICYDVNPMFIFVPIYSDLPDAATPFLLPC